MEKTHRKTIKAIFQAKQKRRLELGELPIEEKVRILVEIQKIALPILLSRGCKRVVWKL